MSTSELPLSKQLSSSTLTCCNCAGCRGCLPSSCVRPSVSCSTVLTICFRLFILTFLGVSIFLVIFFWAPLSTFFLNVLRELRTLPPLYGALIVVGANVVAALMFLPCLPLTLATGFIFKTVRGTILICIASTIASVLGFLIGRYVARGAVERNLGGKNSSLRVIDNAIQQDGFRVVFLVRLSPIHPYALMNYLFGLTSVTLRDYTFASFFALLPATMMEVYSGAALSSIEDISRGDKSVVSSVLLGVGLLVTVVSSVVITLWVRRKLKLELDKYTPVSDDELDGDGENEDGQGISLERIDVSDDSEVEKDASAVHKPTKPLHASSSEESVFEMDGERRYASENEAAVTSSKQSAGEPQEESKMPTASDLETDASSPAASPVVAPAASPSQLRSRQSPSNSPARVVGSTVPSSHTAPVHVTLRPASYSSTAPSLAPAPLSSPSSTSNTLLARSSSSSSNSSGSNGSSAGVDDEQDKLIKHS